MSTSTSSGDVYAKMIRDHGDAIKTITKNTAICLLIADKSLCNIKGDKAGAEALQKAIESLEKYL